MEFRDVIRSEEELRALMGGPVAPPVVDKTLSALDRHCLTFIARSPFVLVATSDGAGRMDVSPKGDAPGFVRVLDEKTLVSPIARATSASTPSATSFSRRASG